MTNSSNNLASRVSMLAAAGLLVATPSVNAKNNIVLSDIQSSINSSYQGEYYSPKANTSNQYAPIHITKDMLFEAEIEKFKQLISINFNTEVTAT